MNTDQVEEQYVNNILTSLSGNITSGATSITVASSSGFPTAGPYNIVIDSEIIRVTGGWGTTTWTVTRGQEGSTAASHTSGATVAAVLTVQGMKNLVALNGVGDPLDRGSGIYLLSCHKSLDQLAYLMVSVDGINFRALNAKNFYTPGSGNQRDPVLMVYNNRYWIAHTNGSNTYWTLLSSHDLVNWSVVANVSTSSVVGLNLTWAPRFFIDLDGSVYVFVTLSTSGSTTNFQVYYQKATDQTNLTTWTNPTLITLAGGAGRADMIDACVVYRSGTYYLFYKDDSTKYIEVLSSSTLLGTWSQFQSTNWAGWGSGYEAPSLLQVDSSTWRIYVNQNSGLNSVATLYSESTDGWVTWSALTSIKSPWITAHSTVLKIRDFPTVKNILGAFFTGNRPVGAQRALNSGQSFSSGSGATIIFDTTDQDDDGFYNSSHPTRLTATAPGWYMITARAAWSTGNNNGRRVHDLLRNGTDFFMTVGEGNFTSTFNNPTFNLAALKWLDLGDYIEVDAFQDSGSTLTLGSAALTLVRLSP